MERVKYVLICLSALLLFVTGCGKNSNLRRQAALNPSLSSLN